MKHPGYSGAKNQYAQRSTTKLSTDQRKEHSNTMSAFSERLKTLIHN